MAFDAAQFLRSSIRTPAYESLQQTQMHETQRTAAPAETGRAMGVNFAVEPDPIGELLDSMEELSFQFEEKTAKTVGDRKMGEARKSATQYLAAVEKWSKAMPDMPGREFLDGLLRQLAAAKRNGGLPNARQLLGQLSDASDDPSHQFAMLDALEQALSGDAETLELVRDVKARLQAEKGPEIQAGLNLAEEVNARATTPEEMQGLRDLYRGEVIGFDRPQTCFRSLLASRGAEGLQKALDFLQAGCGADLQSATPSQSPEELRRIVVDLQCVQVLKTMLEKVGQLANRMSAQFGETCRLTGEEMAGRVVDFTEKPFVGEGDVGDFIAACGLEQLLAQMDFCKELIGVFRGLSSRLFAKESVREQLVDAGQEHLDGLVSLEDEAERERQAGEEAAS